MSVEEQVDYEYPDQHLSGGGDEIGNENPSDDVHNNNSNNTNTFKNIRHQPNANGIIDNVLFLSKFAVSTTEEDLRSALSKYGPLGSISITNNGTIAFVDFVNAEDCLRAKNELHHQPGFGSDSLVADFKKPTSRGPRGGRDDREYRTKDREDFRDRDYDRFRARDGLNGGYDDRRRPGPDYSRDYRSGPPSRTSAGYRDYADDYRVPPRGPSRGPPSGDLREEAIRLQRHSPYLTRDRSRSRDQDRRGGPRSPPLYRDDNYPAPRRDRGPLGHEYYDSAPSSSRGPPAGYDYPPRRDYRDDYRSSGPPPPPYDDRRGPPPRR